MLLADILGEVADVEGGGGRDRGSGDGSDGDGSRNGGSHCFF
jgi:hypothetical protein